MIGTYGTIILYFQYLLKVLDCIVCTAHRRTVGCVNKMYRIVVIQVVRLHLESLIFFYKIKNRCPFSGTFTFHG